MTTHLHRCDPQRIAPDTHLVRQLSSDGHSAVARFVSSMVLTGAEPVVVDTGAASGRHDWLADVAALVDPLDVRWLFLSHDDPDHAGNLLAALDRCPNATLVTPAASATHRAALHGVPSDRLRRVGEGDRIDAGDRHLHFVAPPTFDRPSTLGVHDSRSGVYWAADSFATPVTHCVDDVDELEPKWFRDAFLHEQRLTSPWVRWTDAGRWAATVERIRALEPRVVASAHGPPLHGPQIDVAISLLLELPHLPPARVPGQADLDALVAAARRLSA